MNMTMPVTAVKLVFKRRNLTTPTMMVTELVNLIPAVMINSSSLRNHKQHPQKRSTTPSQKEGMWVNNDDTTDQDDYSIDPEFIYFIAEDIWLLSYASTVTGGLRNTVLMNPTWMSTMALPRKEWGFLNTRITRHS